MTDLAAWFAAQLDADESDLRAAVGRAVGATLTWGGVLVWSADRALADITAKRRILAEIVPEVDGMDWRIGREWGDGDGSTLDHTARRLVQLLAAPYASRPGYAPSWAPEQPAHNTAGDAT